MQLDWIYSENLHQGATIERLTNSFVAVLQSLILHCLSPEVGRYTPSDFSKAKLSQEQLDRLMSKVGQPDGKSLHESG